MRGAPPSAHPEMNWIKVTRPPICYHNHHLHRPDIDVADMDDMRKSLSKLKKDFKHRLGGKKRAAEGPWDIAAGETAGSSLSPTRPDSHVTTSGRGEEGSRISADVSRTHSRDQSPQPKPMQAVEGGGNPHGRETDVNEKEVSRSRLRLGPDIGGAMGSSPSREIIRSPSPLSVTPMPPKQEPNSTWAFSPGGLV